MDGRGIYNPPKSLGCGVQEEREVRTNQVHSKIERDDSKIQRVEGG